MKSNFNTSLVVEVFGKCSKLHLNFMNPQSSKYVMPFILCLTLVACKMKEKIIINMKVLKIAALQLCFKVYKLKPVLIKDGYMDNGNNKKMFKGTNFNIMINMIQNYPPSKLQKVY